MIHPHVDTSWKACVMSPFVIFSETNSSFSLYENKYRIHGVDWHCLGGKIKMGEQCVNIELNAC